MGCGGVGVGPGADITAQYSTLGGATQRRSSAPATDGWVAEAVMGARPRVPSSRYTAIGVTRSAASGTPRTAATSGKLGPDILTAQSAQTGKGAGPGGTLLGAPVLDSLRGQALRQGAPGTAAVVVLAGSINASGSNAASGRRSFSSVSSFCLGPPCVCRGRPPPALPCLLMHAPAHPAPPLLAPPQRVTRHPYRPRARRGGPCTTKGSPPLPA